MMWTLFVVQDVSRVCENMNVHLLEYLDSVFECECVSVTVCGVCLSVSVRVTVCRYACVRGVCYSVCLSVHMYLSARVKLCVCVGEYQWR